MMPPVRNTHRDSLLMRARLTVAGQDNAVMVRLRNLSAGGMLGEGAVAVTRDSVVTIELPNIGFITARVIWVSDNKFGLAFDEAINPQAVRRQQVSPTELLIDPAALDWPRAAG